MKRNRIGMGLLLCLPMVALAEALPPVATSTKTQGPSSETAKNVWLTQLKSTVSVAVCKSFIEDDAIKSQMQVRHINYEKCITLLPAISNECIGKHEAAIPASINDVEAEKWGRILGDCIGNTFAMKHLYNTSGH